MRRQRRYPAQGQLDTGVADVERPAARRRDGWPASARPGGGDRPGGIQLPEGFPRQGGQLGGLQGCGPGCPGCGIAGDLMAEDPGSLPRLSIFDEYVDGRRCQWHTHVAVRPGRQQIAAIAGGCLAGRRHVCPKSVTSEIYPVGMFRRPCARNQRHARRKVHWGIRVMRRRLHPSSDHDLVPVAGSPSGRLAWNQPGKSARHKRLASRPPGRRPIRNRKRPSLPVQESVCRSVPPSR